MFCTNCGTKFNHQSNFCSVCGTKIHDVGNHSTKTGNDTGETAKAEQIDLTTKLIGKNVNYYINNWKRQGEFKGWNWVAAFFYLPWLGYRKMYKELFNFLWFYMIVNIVFFRLKSSYATIIFIFDTVFEILIFIGFGYMGNILYKSHIEKMKLEHHNNPTQFSLEKIGGTSIVGLIIGLSIEIVLAIFFWNYW